MGAGLNCGGSACGSATIECRCPGSKTPEAEGRRIAGLRDRRTGARRGGRDLKYSTKPADMVADPEWFLELTRRRTAPLCGDRRRTQDVLKLDQETDADMVIGDDISEATMTVLASRSNGKPRSESTAAHRRKIKLNQTSRVSGRSPDGCGDSVACDGVQLHICPVSTDK